jgi:hypothetical protein
MPNAFSGDSPRRLCRPIAGYAGPQFCCQVLGAFQNSPHAERSIRPSSFRQKRRVATRSPTWIELGAASGMMPASPWLGSGENCPAPTSCVPTHHHPPRPARVGWGGPLPTHTHPLAVATPGFAKPTAGKPRPTPNGTLPCSANGWPGAGSM